MIGNDVVDLALAKQQSNWQRKGFLQKIFTAQEQSWISEASEPEKMVWLLWSMKEAAYKIHNRETGLRTFSPLFFTCGKPQPQSGFYTGKVHFSPYVLQTQSIINDELIVTECFFKKNIKTYIVSDYEGYLNKNTIYKNDMGQPFSKGNIPVSISHHGRFCIVSTYADTKENPFSHEKAAFQSTTNHRYSLLS